VSHEKGGKILLSAPKSNASPPLCTHQLAHGSVLVGEQQTPITRLGGSCLTKLEQLYCFTKLILLRRPAALQAPTTSRLQNTAAGLVRLLKNGQTIGRAEIDTLTLARNARTSPEMIDRFYAAPLQGEMNVAMLQSKNRPRPWELHREL
jgi:hypothetical protein